MISNEQWKGYSKLLQLCVSGLEKSFQSWGLGGMGSTFHILEVAYTHYSDMKTQRTHSTASGFMNIFQQRVYMTVSVIECAINVEYFHSLQRPA